VPTKTPAPASYWTVRYFITQPWPELWLTTASPPLSPDGVVADEPTPKS
jgi:hypothetical protein